MKGKFGGSNWVVIGFIQGLLITLRSALRSPVTAEYPSPEKRMNLAERYMGFPALTWDSDVEEPYCTGCMVCVRECPTQCMNATMQYLHYHYTNSTCEVRDAHPRPPEPPTRLSRANYQPYFTLITNATYST